MAPGWPGESETGFQLSCSREVGVVGPLCSATEDPVRICACPPRERAQRSPVRQRSAPCVLMRIWSVKAHTPQPPPPPPLVRALPLPAGGVTARPPSPLPPHPLAYAWMSLDHDDRTVVLSSRGVCPCGPPGWAVSAEPSNNPHTTPTPLSTPPYTTPGGYGWISSSLGFSFFLPGPLRPSHTRYRRRLVHRVVLRRSSVQLRTQSTIWVDIHGCSAHRMPVWITG